ncbi:MAG: ATP-binding cassette domain-containing protein [Clostridia bacterium]
MASVAFQNLSFIYNGAKKIALKNINLSIKEGEYVVVIGESGSGKTTLLRHLKQALCPHGIRTGSVSIFGSDNLSPRDDALNIGFVVQDADAQAVCDTVLREIQFALLNLGFSDEDIRARTAETVGFLSIDSLLNKKISELSGGQKQLVNLASVMILRPKILILDEPTAQLDPIAANDFLSAVKRLNSEFGVTVILSEHRLETVMPEADMVIVLENGNLLAFDTPNAIGKFLRNSKNPLLFSMPAPIYVYSQIESTLPCPLTVAEGRRFLSDITNNTEPKALFLDNEESKGEIALEIKNAWFRYEKNSPDILKGLDFYAKKGEITAIMGGNGLGKTTLLKVIAGINPVYRGKVNVFPEKPNRGSIALLPQDASVLFLHETVRAELNFYMVDEIYREEMITAFKLGALLDMHPFDLSGGERQRLALAIILSKKPEICLLDEPTRGMDANFKHFLTKTLKSLNTTFIIVTHDAEFCAETADTTALFFDGGIVCQKRTRAVFMDNCYYTTAASRMARHVFSDAITSDEIVFGITGNPESQIFSHIDNKTIDKRSDFEATTIEPSKKETKSRMKKLVSKNKTLPITLLSLALIPIVIAITYILNINYYFTSVLIAILTIVPFWVSFSNRPHKAREVVLIAVLIAIAVASRVAFFFAPSFKPMGAFIIIAGICFGANTGFMVGSVSALVSNFFFGQGPFTPFQMLGFALIGLFAGLIFNKRRNLIFVSVYSFLSTFVIYGLIVDFNSILMLGVPLTFYAMLPVYLAGVPLNLIHALAVFLCTLFIFKPVEKKLSRVVRKYSLFDFSYDSI